MALVDTIKKEEFTLGVWRVEEDEATLKELVGGTLFPGLDKISNPKRRLEWLAARSMIKQFGHNGLVLYHPSRRPFLANSRSHLSISHSYPYVAVILSHNFLVGVDIESYKRSFTPVAHKYLSNQEKLWINPADNKKLSLIWSAKEALYKLPGMEGLSGADMDIKPFEKQENSGELKATIRLGGTSQRFNVNYYYLNEFQVVWVCCNPKVLVW
jgi:phosphopantetheinyl transferase (holo-ACP synthase)